MIIRAGISCETCGKAHVVRIGMGQEERQSHRFPCRGCGEDIAIALEVDFVNISSRVVPEENALYCEEIYGPEIVNLDANFLVPNSFQGKDIISMRLAQMHRLLKANGDLDRILSNKISDDKNSSSKSFRRPDYAAEWRVLKKAWSLRQSGRAKLSHRKVIEGSSSFYENDPLEDFLDWLWRFSSKICQPAYENIFLEASKSISLLHEAGQLNKFESHYKTNMAPLRARYYFEVMREYFSNYSEFSQVHFLLSNGVEIRDDEQASSQHFDSTKMFYGNNFEAFASLVDVLALVNNVAAGRNFNVFGKLTLEEYYKLDKSGRFNPFSMNSKFAALCGEADNQLRNASHHGGMIFDRNTQNIKYRAGKGGIGPENSISYAKYLERCVRIFLQTMTLLRIELMFCREFGNEVPF